MSGRRRIERYRWVDAARQAPAAFFELVAPDPEHRWAGGFGMGEDGPTGLDVLQTVNGVEVCIRTNFADHIGPHLLRAEAFDVVWQSMMNDPNPITEPVSWTLSPTTRTISVNGVATSFDCLEINTGEWVGVAALPGDNATSVAVRVHGALDGPFALATCTTTDMSDHPPLRQ